jgi:hypothetical protein
MKLHPKRTLSYNIPVYCGLSIRFMKKILKHKLLSTRIDFLKVIFLYKISSEGGIENRMHNSTSRNICPIHDIKYKGNQ